MSSQIILPYRKEEPEYQQNFLFYLGFTWEDGTYETCNFKGVDSPLGYSLETESRTMQLISNRYIWEQECDNNTLDACGLCPWFYEELGRLFNRESLEELIGSFRPWLGIFRINFERAFELFTSRDVFYAYTDHWGTLNAGCLTNDKFFYLDERLVMLHAGYYRLEEVRFTQERLNVLLEDLMKLTS